MDEEQIAIITREWSKVAPRLLRFVRYRIGLGLLPEAHDAEDVVQMAFERLISGSRGWDHHKVDIETHMKKSILRSMLGTKGLPSVKDASGVEFTDAEDSDHLDMNGVKSSDANREMLPEIDKAAAFTRLEQDIAGDKELEDLLAAIRMGYRKPADIAEMTGMDVKKIYYLQTKLATHTQSVQRYFRDDCGKESL